MPKLSLGPDHHFKPKPVDFQLQRYTDFPIVAADGLILARTVLE